MKAFILILCLLSSVDSFSKFAPDNDLWIGPEEKSTTMDEITFNQTIDILEEIYTPIVESEGYNLKIIRKWNDGTVNAYAVPNGNDWEVASEKPSDRL